MQKQIREKEEGTLSEYYWTKTEWKKTIEEKLLYEKGICHNIDVFHKNLMFLGSNWGYSRQTNNILILLLFFSFDLKFQFTENIFGAAWNQRKSQFIPK